MVTGHIRSQHDGLNLFFQTGFAHWTPATDDAVYSVVLIPGMVFVTLLKADAATRALWAAGNTRTVVGGKVRNWDNHLLDATIGELFVGALKEHHKRHAAMSPEERAKIEADRVANPMAALDADTPLARARIEDFKNRELFGSKRYS